VLGKCPDGTAQEREGLRALARSAWSRLRVSGFSAGTLVLGLVGSLAVFTGGIGCAGIPVTDPFLGDGTLSVLRYGYGRDLATVVLYLGLGLMVWAWVRLGRDVLAGRSRGRAVVTCAGAWLVPMLLSPSLFTRDVYAYLAQGALALHGVDSYTVGPEVLSGPITDNVDGLWQTTGSPYGPLFLLLAKGVVAVTGNGVISGVLLMRLVMLPGLALLMYALPGLVGHLGGRTPVALWITVTNPLILTQLVGGPHNDLSWWACSRPPHCWSLTAATARGWRWPRPQPRSKHRLALPCPSSCSSGPPDCPATVGPASARPPPRAS
jgi:hypothetical protein